LRRGAYFRMASAWYNMRFTGSKNLRVRVITGFQWFDYRALSTTSWIMQRQERTTKYRAELPPENYESGGQEFESLRARHVVLICEHPAGPF
jgi:hypothetical protein